MDKLKLDKYEESHPRYVEGDCFFRVVISYADKEGGGYHRFIDGVYEKDITQEEMVRVISAQEVY